MRFVFGFIIIGLSIYVFYIGMAKKNTPALLASPQPISPGTYQGEIIRTDTFEVSLPKHMDYRLSEKGMEIYSMEQKTRGKIECLTGLPKEKQWRTSLERPTARFFLGNTGNMEPFDLMIKILRHRWNPSLMGIKSRLIPPWMKGDPEGKILVPEGSRIIIFYTKRQALGLKFGKEFLAVSSTTGQMDAPFVAAFIQSINIL